MSIMNPATMLPERWQDFQVRAIMLAGRKVDPLEFNECRLLNLNSPICMSSVVNRPKSVKSLDSAEAGGLLDTLELLLSSHKALSVIFINFYKTQ